MVIRVRLYFVLIFLFLLMIQASPTNARDSFAFSSASFERIGPESEASIKATIGEEARIINSLSLSGSPPSEEHLIGPGTAVITIISSVQGYDAYVDGYLIETEGRNDPLDGQITIRVDGGLTHTIRIVAGSYSNQTTGYYEMGRSYTINL